MRSLILTILLLGALSGCTPYEYEEDLDLEVDGSGEIRVSGTEELFRLLYGIDEDLDISAVTDRFESPELEVVSIERSHRRGHGYLHVRARFEDVRRLSDQAIFSGRRYRLESGDRYLDLTVDIRHVQKQDTPERLREGSFRFRVHFPSPVRHHNSDTGIERGNIITWEQSLSDHLAGEPLHIEARFERRTVLRVTLTLLAVALSVVVFVISASIFILVRIGRRQMASEDPPSSTSLRGNSSNS